MTEPTHPTTPPFEGGPSPRVARRTVMVGGAALTALVAAPLPIAAATGSHQPPVPEGWTGSLVDFIADRQRRWIFTYDKSPGDPAFDISTKFADYYDFVSGDVAYYDDLAPEQATATSAVEYGTFFAPLFDALGRAEHAIEREPVVVASTELATSYMVFIGRFTAADGSVSGIRTHSTIALRNSGNRRDPNGWRIVREHNCSVALEAGEVDDLFATLPTGPA